MKDINTTNDHRTTTQASYYSTISSKGNDCITSGPFQMFLIGWCVLAFNLGIRLGFTPLNFPCEFGSYVILLNLNNNMQQSWQK